MKPVTGFSHYAALTANVRADRKRLVSNCYLMPPEIMKYTDRRQMFYREDPQGLYFYCEEEDLYHLYFYLFADASHETPIGIQPLDKPIIIDLVVLDSMSPQAIGAMKEPWKQIGFKEYLVFRLMTLDPSSTREGTEKELDANHQPYRFGFARRDQLDPIRVLWRRSLDILSTPLPTDDELLTAMENQQVMCVFSQENTVAAAMQLLRSGKVGTIKHVAVDEAHRRRGLAKRLVGHCLREHTDIHKFVLWVEQDNLPAIALYQKMGFVFDNKTSHQLLMEASNLQDRSV